VSVRPPVCPVYGPLQQRAASLLLGAPPAEDIGALAVSGRPASKEGTAHGAQQHMRAVPR